MDSPKVSFLDKISFYSLISTFFLSIFFFVPFIPVTLDASKGFLVSVGVAVSVFFWLLARLLDGKFLIPKDRIIFAALSIPLVFLIASFFSSSPYTSLFGGGFELGTFGSMLVLFLVLFLSSIHFQSEKRISHFFKALFLGTLVLSIFQIIYLFVDVSKLSPTLFSGMSSGNLIGSWNDFVLFFGLMVILSLFTLEFLNNKLPARIVLYIIVAVGLFFLIVINTPLVWLLVGIFSLIIFVYSISTNQIHSKKEEDYAPRKLPVTSLVVMIVSLLFLIGSGSLGILVSKYVNVYNPDIRPSTSATLNIGWHAIKHNPFFGTGPNTFNLDWSLWKPAAVKNTIYWNTDFTNGVGLIPTYLATAGILGVLAWLVFIIMFIVRGSQALKFVFQKSTSNYFFVTSFIFSLYGFIVMIMYTPSILLTMLTFASTGLFLAVLVTKKILPVYNFSFLNDPRSSFFSILALVVLMFSSISMIYIYVEKFTSVIYFSKGIAVKYTDINSLAQSDKLISEAILLDKNDFYYRSLSQVYIAEMAALLKDKNESKDTLKSNIQSLVNSAESAATAAVAQNPKQYLNLMNLGNVYSALVPLGVSNAYENANIAYDKTQLLTPNNPSILLAKAQLEVVNKNNSKAKEYLNQAVVMKSDYVDAYLALAQIASGEGDLNTAISQAENAATASPNIPSVFFQLGVYRYNNQSYEDAVGAFERALTLDLSDASTRFYLAKSYQKAGRNEESVAQFKILNQMIPNNKDIQDAMLGTSTTPDVKVDLIKKPVKNSKLTIPSKK